MPRPQHTLYDASIEQATLGVTLRAPAAIDAAVAAGVTETSFFLPWHSSVWSAITSVHAAGNAADPITVAAWLRDRQLLEMVDDNGDYLGGEARLIELESGAGYERSVPTYAATLVDLEHQRYVYNRLHEAANGQFAQRGAIIADIQEKEAAWATGGDTKGLFVDFTKLDDVEEDPPTIGIRSDGACALLYPGRFNNIIGESESCKSMLGQAMCVEQLKLGNHAIYVDYEKDALSVRERLREMGVDDDMLDRFHYVSKREDPWSPGELAMLRQAMDDLSPTVAVVDGVTNAMALEGLNPLDNQDVSKFYGGIPLILSANNCAVVAIDHLTKAKPGEVRAKGALGAQHKRAGIDGASFKMMLSGGRFGRGMSARAELIIDKDAPGWLRPHAPDDHVAAIWLHSEVIVVEGVERYSLTVRIDPSQHQPAERVASGGIRYTACMEKISRALEAYEDGFELSGTQIVKDVPMREDTVRAALRSLVAEGYLTPRHKGSSIMHKLVRPFREAAPAEPTTPRSFYEPGDDAEPF